MTTTTPAVSTSFAQTAMLVSLNIRSYGAKKEDKKVSRKVASDNGTSTDAGNYQKNLIPKEALEPITKAIGALRTFHYENTLPWLDEGVRILPSMNYESYKTQLETHRDAYDVAVRDFCAGWPAIVAGAQASLNGLFNPADYPTDVRARFGCQVRFMPLSDAADFRVAISDTERDMLRAQIEGTLGEAQSAAMGDIYKRLADAVKAMAERLRAYSVDPVTGKTSSPFRDSLVDNLRELVVLVPRLNFAADAELEAVRVLVERELCGATPETLRGDDALRSRVADSADAIADRLGEFMA